MIHVQRNLLPTALVATLTLTLNVAALHGASYQSPTTATSSSSSAPATGGPSTWWALNRRPYLDLKRELYAAGARTGSEEFFLGHGEQEQLVSRLRPTEQQIERSVVPALLRALERDESVDITTGSLMALAKIGGNRSAEDRGELARIFVAHLDDGSQQVRETAALALGALGDTTSRATLTNLLRDNNAGRALVGRARVGDRTRAFAAFGIGLVGRRCQTPVESAAVARELIAVLDEGTRATPDLEVACVTALGLVRSRSAGSPREQNDSRGGRRTDGVVEAAVSLELEQRAAQLLEILDDGHRHAFVRAHVPTALARLHDAAPDDAASGGASELRAAIRTRLLAAVGPRAKAERAVVQGALLALGEIGTADDAALRAALFAVTSNAAGGEERSFALMALARAGGRRGGSSGSPGPGGPGPGGASPGDAGSRAVTTILIKQLASGAQVRRGWAALALGVQAHRLRSAGFDPSTAAIRALRSTLVDNSEPGLVGAAAVGLGLTGDSESASLLLEKLGRVSVDGARGSICEALGLLGARAAIEPLRRVVEKSEFHPYLLASAAVALGLLGDTQAVPRLIAMLGRARSLAGQAGLAIALGTIGDARSLDPLVVFLEDETKTKTARAFAAVALGLASDTSLLPWNEALRSGVQYNAATSTLMNGAGTGVLDIL